MDETIQQALTQNQLIDITTIGRRTGQPRRKEIWFHYQDGRVYITGTPGRRDWYANLVAHPDFTFHLKQSVRRDIPARAIPITDKSRRREIFTRMQTLEPRMAHVDVDAWTEGSALVEVELRG